MEGEGKMNRIHSFCPQGSVEETRLTPLDNRGIMYSDKVDRSCLKPCLTPSLGQGKESAS